MTELETLSREIGDLVELHDRRWCELDMWGVAALWDTSGVPVYVGDEYPQPLVGWSDLNRHWGRLGSRLQAAAVASTPIVIRLLSPTVVTMVMLCEWELVTVESDQARSGRSWIAWVVTRADAGWRIVQSVESAVFIDGEYEPPQLAVSS
jgi:hypothetical protein